jgi:hypothetical protein
MSGEMESTIVKSFMLGGNLRRWLNRMDCPPAIKELKRLFNKTFPPLTQVYAIDEDDASMKSKSNVAYYTVKTSPFGRFVYSRYSHHVGNSVIVYCNPDRNSEIIAGEIQRIDILDGRPYFTVKRNAPLPAASYDPFHRYPDFHARCYSSTFLPTKDKISLDSIISHGARLSLSGNRSVVLNLSRL